MITKLMHRLRLEGFPQSKNKTRVRLQQARQAKMFMTHWVYKINNKSLSIIIKLMHRLRLTTELKVFLKDSINKTRVRLQAR